MTETLTFPPLLSGEAATDEALGHAARRAALGCDAGLVSYILAADRVEAAMVFAPEVPLRQAMAMLPLCGVGLQNALGALAPPEVAVHLEWSGGVRVNGAACGRLRALSDTQDADAVPDWLVVGWTMPLIPASEETGLTPDQTTLYAEGCAEIAPPALVEAWARHTLNWVTKWEEAGPRGLAAEWRGLAHGIGEDVRQGGRAGTFLGVDEDFGMLLRDDEATHLIPLTDLLKGS
jgi:biotin-(acetyl-CoA carboxylase) ligase